MEFLSKEFVDMIHKGQWVVLPASIARKLQNLQVSPPRVVPNETAIPGRFVTVVFPHVNEVALTLSAIEAM